VFFLQFCGVATTLVVIIPTRGISQNIWRKLREESRKDLKNPTIFWRLNDNLLSKYGDFRGGKNKPSKSNDFGHFRL
jgi:hypothetical protein